MHINIGFDHMVNWDKVMLVIPGGTKMAKRRKEAADADGKLQDCTNKRGYGSMLLMDDGWVFISYLKPDTLLLRSAPREKAPLGLSGPVELTPPEAEGADSDSSEPSPSLPQVTPVGRVQDELGTVDPMQPQPEEEPEPGLTLLDAMERADRSRRD